MSAVITGSQNGTVGLINVGTAVASTSGTSIDFTGIPAGVRRITVMLNGVSASGSSIIIVRIGDVSGILPAGSYAGTASSVTAAAASTTAYTSGFAVGHAAASAVNTGALILTHVSSNSWIATGIISRSESSATLMYGGGATLSGTLTQLRITTVNGTDTFDAGSINILYE